MPMHPSKRLLVLVLAAIFGYKDVEGYDAPTEAEAPLGDAPQLVANSTTMAPTIAPTLNASLIQPGPVGAPVLSVYLANHLVHISGARDGNPAGTGDTSDSNSSTWGNPYLKNLLTHATWAGSLGVHSAALMADAPGPSSANGWFIGAAVSAVTGIALVSYDRQRKTTTATTTATGVHV
jgi:hypothetical protein